MDRWLDRVLSDPACLTPISRTAADGTTREIAVAVESPNLIAVTFQEDGWSDREVVWTERRVLVRSHGQAKAGTRALHRRIDQALNDLGQLNRPRRGQPRLVDGAMAQEAVDAILRQHRVDGLIQISIAEYAATQWVRGYRGQPAEERRTSTVVVTPTVDSQAVAADESRLGWRVYATNQPAADLSLESVVLAYRDQYLAEQGMGRLKGPLSITPMHLTRDDHRIGLIRLLSLGLRVLTLIQFVIRQQVAAQDTPMAGLYAGQPNRTTMRPTTEQVLNAFRGLTLTRVMMPSQPPLVHLTPLSAIQKRLLEVLDFGTIIYTKLCGDSS
jgi:transposase